MSIAPLQRALARLNRSSDERERGFSLIELIVVVAIIGILVAIAIPVYGAIQDSARENAVKAAAQNGATQVSSNLASGVDANTDLGKLNTEEITVTVVSSTSAADVCVKAANTKHTDVFAQAGPGCPAPAA